MENNCETCKWWDTEHFKNVEGMEYMAGDIGLCRRNAPVVHKCVEASEETPLKDFITEWPSTWSDDWCGEWMQPLW